MNIIEKKKKQFPFAHPMVYIGPDIFYIILFDRVLSDRNICDHLKKKNTKPSIFIGSNTFFHLVVVFF